MTTNEHDRPIFQRLEQLNAIGAALSSERNIDRLLESILLAAKKITHADGGTLYLVSEDGQGLHFAIMHNDTLGITLGGTSGNRIDFHDLPFTNDQGKRFTRQAAGSVACAPR